MKKDVISEVFRTLRSIGIVSSETDFSIDWLGQSESYFRSLRFRKTEPSLGVVAICGTRLLEASDFIRQSPRHKMIADKLQQHGQRCQQIVNEDAARLVLL